MRPSAADFKFGTIIWLGVLAFVSDALLQSLAWVAFGRFTSSVGVRYVR